MFHVLQSSGGGCSCDGISRRNFLRFGALGLSLPRLLRDRAEARGLADQAPTASSCIFVYLPGSPGHQDTWDPKPDAPAEFRGEFKPISTNVSGIRLGEHLPKLSQLADKYCLVRSCHHDDPEHNSAAYAYLTGRMHPRKGQIVAPSPR